MIEVPRWQQALFERRNLGVKLDLSAVRAVHAALGSPAAGIPGLHVIGTNGKGSTAAMAAHALQRRGRRVGLYTSPHLHRVGERVRIDGVVTSDEAMQGLCDRVLAVESAGPRALTFFEVLTLAALLAFETGEVDVMVLEAGLGGRLDATRLGPGSRIAATLFTPIALDHTAYLGPTIAAIAGEKAAVMADGAPAYSAPQVPEAEAVLRATAAACKVPLTFVEPLARAPLAGEHQRVNAGLALAGARVLAPEVRAADLEGTVWPGRLERRAVGGGVVVFDVAHNPHGISALVQALRASPVKERVVLFGCLADKDGPGMVAGLAALDCPLWLAPLAGVGSEEVRALVGGAARVFAGLDDRALAAACTELLARGGELVVCGSHHTVGHVRGEFLAVAGDARALSDPR